MPEPFTHDFRIFSGSQEQRRARVAQIIQPEFLVEVSSLQNEFEVPANEVPLVKRLSILRRKDKPVLVVVWPCFELALSLFNTVLP